MNTLIELTYVKEIFKYHTPFTHQISLFFHKCIFRIYFIDDKLR